LGDDEVAGRDLVPAGRSRLAGPWCWSCRGLGRTSDHIGLLVLGFDEQQKPCGGSAASATMTSL
jgi:hypothetical protein